MMVYANMVRGVDVVVGVSGMLPLSPLPTTTTTYIPLLISLHARSQVDCATHLSLSTHSSLHSGRLHASRSQVSCVDAERDADNDRVEHTAQLKHAGRDLQPLYHLIFAHSLWRTGLLYLGRP
jgi:hypothetical protein